MYKKEFTQLDKAAYLCCCKGIKCIEILPPKDGNSKARFLIQAPFKQYLDILEAKWDKPHLAGHPGIPSARKYFWKMKKFRGRAMAVCKKE